MNIFDYLDELQADLLSKNLEEIEDKYFNICSRLAGQDSSNKIREVNLEGYEQELTALLNESIELAHKHKAKAIYFEFDLDNNWDSAFFVCGDYSPLENEDDDWASDWYEDLEGPNLEQFGEIYDINGFDENDAARGSTIYLVARTVISFIRAYNNLPTENSLAFCIAFHDQDPILRVKD